ncbi:hypothetical protein ADEAN_000218000 [Angomonas deanei]|uniref:Uncharacterized protein n=1 Tax=Angomonas deanei TaxID=59799 RepID=A0A7G2C542_9TRYP|nr:hypothetical protein ADEAN_000218000 [Angomonas deanei]
MAKGKRSEAKGSARQQKKLLRDNIKSARRRSDILLQLILGIVERSQGPPICVDLDILLLLLNKAGLNPAAAPQHFGLVQAPCDSPLLLCNISLAPPPPQQLQPVVPLTHQRMLKALYWRVCDTEYPVLANAAATMSEPKKMR